MPKSIAKIVVQGAKGVAAVPGLAEAANDTPVVIANTLGELKAALPGAEVLLGWDFQADSLRAAWSSADRLQWVHWSGAGVDAILFPELVHSDVVLTNARGIFDGAMAEYVLGLILAMAKGFPLTLRLQAEAHWQHRLTERVAGRRVTVVGVGSIGREIARILTAVGLSVCGVGRTARSADPDFTSIYAVSALSESVRDADYVVLVTPLTAATRGLFGKEIFAAMRPSARFINVGRGALVDEAAMVEALTTKQIDAAALDVFATEPLPTTSPLWGMPNVIVSPHMSGDFVEFAAALADLFRANLAAYRQGNPLENVIDKQLGFVV